MSAKPIFLMFHFQAFGISESLRRTVNKIILDSDTDNADNQKRII